MADEKLVEQSGLLEFLKEDKDNGGISDLFVSTIAESLSSANDASVLVKAVESFLKEYDIKLDDKKSLENVCTILLTKRKEESAKGGGAKGNQKQQKGKQQQQQKKKQKGKDDDSDDEKPAGKAKQEPPKESAKPQDEDDGSKKQKPQQQQNKQKEQPKEDEKKKEEDSSNKKNQQKGKKGKRKGDDSDDEEEQTKQKEQEEKESNNNKKNQQKGKKGKRKGDDSDDEEEQTKQKEQEENNNKKNQQKGKKGKRKGDDSDDEEEQKGQKESNNDSENNKETQQQKGKQQQQQNQNQKGKQQQNKEKEKEKQTLEALAEKEESEGENDDEDQKPQTKQNNKKPQQQQATSMFDMLEQEESNVNYDDVVEAEKKNANKQQNQQKGGNKANTKQKEKEEAEKKQKEEAAKKQKEEQELKAKQEKEQKEKEEEEKKQKEKEEAEKKQKEKEEAEKKEKEKKEKEEKERKEKEKKQKEKEEAEKKQKEEEERAKKEKEEAEAKQKEEAQPVKALTRKEKKKAQKEEASKGPAPINTDYDEHGDHSASNSSTGAKSESSIPLNPKSMSDFKEEERKGSESMSKDIKVEKFDLSFPGKILFKNATLSLAHGRKYGLIAPNGSGKSTLLNNIAQRANEFIAIPKHFDIHYVEQEVEGTDVSAIDTVIAADVERTRLLAEEKFLLEESEKDNPDFDYEKAGFRLQQVYARLEEIDAYSAEARASSILSGLQFDEDMKVKATKSFSGGWRMRISIARALFRRPTLLLLDEPTNHLDLYAVIWLESYLKNWKNTLLIVSHDQDFLNSVCTDIIHIHQQKLDYYRGDYYAFKKIFTERQDAQMKAFEKQQKVLKQEKQMKGKGEKEKATTKARDQVKVIRNKQLATKSKAAKEEMEDNQSELIERPRDYTVHFEFPEPDTLSIPIIQVKRAGFAYNNKQTIFQKLEFGIDMESRISLVGPNGTGKTTLLKLLEGELSPTAGSIEINRKLIIGRFNQHFVDVLKMDQNPVEYLHSRFPEVNELELRKHLGRFGLTGKTHLQKISSLSGGQKSRVVFADICMRRPHLLFLDEPTNHLDIESIDALAEALNEFQGGIVLISHDSRLIQQVCHDEHAQVWVCGKQTVKIFDGDFDEYRNQLMEEFEEKQKQEDEERKVKEEERRIKREAERAQKEKILKDRLQKHQKH